MRMMASVSTLASISGAATPLSTVNFSMLKRARIGDFAGQRRCCGHHRTGEMGARTRPLAADEIAVRGGNAALARCDELAIGAGAKRAARLAPFEAGVEDRKSTRLNSSHLVI